MSDQRVADLFRRVDTNSARPRAHPHCGSRCRLGSHLYVHGVANLAVSRLSWGSTAHWLKRSFVCHQLADAWL